jgi:hypothetical protein
MGNNKKKRLTTKNDKMVTNINKGVKIHIGNTKGARLDIKFLFLANRGHEDNKG